MQNIDLKRKKERKRKCSDNITKILYIQLGLTL